MLLSERIEAEFENWCRWLNYGPPIIPPPLRRAASAEGNYVRESNRYREAPRPAPLPPDAQRAEVVERVYRTQLTAAEQRVVAAEWPKRYASGRARYGRAGAARRLGIPLIVYEGALIRAARLVDRALGAMQR